jgi:endonuclease YncB( thermonuclease family)
MSVTVDFKFKRQLRQANDHKLLRTADGDTPYIEQPVRMVSVDTPEKAGYAGLPETAQKTLDECRRRLEENYYPDVPEALRKYFIKRLSAKATQYHIAAGNMATEEFEKILEERLTRPDGRKRRVAVIATGQVIDNHGRLLAYLAPWYTGSGADPLPPKDDPRRQTFNLNMIQAGWATFFPIYPSLPQNDDMNLAIAAAEASWDDRKGMWGQFGRNLLLAYEYRMCVKLGRAKSTAQGMKEAFQRHCVDLRTMRLVGLFGFHRVPPPYRLWVWQDDLEQAKSDLEVIE